MLSLVIKKTDIIYATALVFSLVYGIKFSFFPLSLSKVALITLFIEYITMKDTVKAKSLPLSLIAITCIFLLCGIYSAFITSIRGINDFDFLLKAIYLIYEPLLGGFLLSQVFFLKYKFTVRDFAIILRNVGFIQSVLTIAAYLVPNVNLMYDAIIPNTGNLTVDQNLRVRGFTNLGGAWLSVMLSFSVLCGVYLVEIANSLKDKLLNIIIVVICTAATIAVGRTGLMLSLVIICIYLTRWLFMGGGLKNVVALIGTIFVIISITLIVVPDINDMISEETIDWAFEIFLNQDAGYSTASTDELSSMIYLPDDKIELIFGSGFYESGYWKSKRSDSGFIKTIFSIGLLGSVFFYSVYLYIAQRTILGYSTNSNLSFFLMLMFSMIFIVEIKEPYLQTIGVPMIIFSIYFISRTIHYKNTLDD